MTTAQVAEASVIVKNSPIQDYAHPNDHAPPTYELTPGFKPFTAIFLFFQTGVVIVDSPGIGESDIMDNIVVQYLPNAFAFIYVINSTMAGGVQKDRVSVSSLQTNKYSEHTSS